MIRSTLNILDFFSDFFIRSEVFIRYLPSIVITVKPAKDEAAYLLKITIYTTDLYLIIYNI